MGGTFTALSSDSGLPKVKKTVLQTVFDPVLNVIDAPANATRSIVAGMRTGQNRFYTNALKSVIPFVGSEEVSAAEATGSDSTLTNMAFLVLVDPLLPITAVGRLTKTGKILQGIRSANVRRKTLEAVGRFEDAAEETARMKGLMTQLRKQPMLEYVYQGKKRKRLAQPRRSVISLGVWQGRDFGDASNVRHVLSMSPVGLLPDTRRIMLTDELDALKVKKVGLESRLADKLDEGLSVTFEDKQIAKLTKDILLTTNRLNDTTKFSILPVRAAQALKTTARKFGGRSEEVQTIIDVRKTSEAKDIAALGKEKSEALRRLDDLAKDETVEQAALLRRMLVASESRQFDPRKRQAAIDAIDVLGEENIIGGARIPQTPQQAAVQLGVAEGKRISEARAKADKALKKIDARDIISPSIQRDTEKIIADLDYEIANVRLKNKVQRMHLAKVAKVWAPGGLNSDELRFLDRLWEDSDKLIDIENNVRIGITSLESETLDYVARILSPEAKALRGVDKKKYSLLMNEARQRLGAQNMRKFSTEKAIGDINREFRATSGLDFDFFEPNVIEAHYARRVDHIRNIHKAAAANTLVKMYAKPGIHGQRAVDFLKDVGLEAGEIGNKPAISKDLFIPRNRVEELTNLDKFLKKSVFEDANFIKLMSTMDRTINTLFRVGLTTIFPAFHMRNMFSNMVLNALGGVTNPKWYLEAANLQRKMKSGAKLIKQEAKLVEEILEFNIPRSGMIQEFFGEGAKTGVGQFLEKRLPIKVGRAVGEGVENNARIAHYLAKRSGGATPLESLRSVNKYLFDYSDLTEFEKKIMRPTFLFYTWIRKNVPLMIATSLKNPRLINQWNKLTGINDGEVPDYLQSASVFALPGGRAISDPGFPFADLRVTNVDDALTPTNMGAIGRLTGKIASRMSPIPKLAYELMTQRSAFSQRNITNDFPGFLSANLPTSRIIQTTSKLLDKEDPTVMRALYALAGVRTFKYNPARAKEDVLEKVGIQQGLLRRFPVVGRRSDIDKDDPEFVALMEKLRPIRRELRGR